MRSVFNKITGSCVVRRMRYAYNDRGLWGPAHPVKPAAIAATICGVAVLLGASGWLLTLPLGVAQVQRARRRRYRRRVADEFRRFVFGPQ